MSYETTGVDKSAAAFPCAEGEAETGVTSKVPRTTELNDFDVQRLKPQVWDPRITEEHVCALHAASVSTRESTLFKACFVLADGKHDGCWFKIFLPNRPPAVFRNKECCSLYQSKNSSSPVLSLKLLFHMFQE